jgi:hypothetical protein
MMTLCNQLEFSKQRYPGCSGASAEGDSSVTFAMQRFNPNGCRLLHENGDLISERRIVNMKTTNSLRVRASRFFSDRYAYRERPDYLIELVAFGIIVITVTLSLASAMATAVK